MLTILRTQDFESIPQRQSKIKTCYNQDPINNSHKNALYNSNFKSDAEKYSENIVITAN